MTSVYFHDHGHEYVVTFNYDRDVVALLKAVPKHYRSWRPETKQWRIASWYSPILARSLRQHEHHTVGIDVRDPPPHRNGHTQSWAQALFSTVGPDRADQVHRALTRILHPDNPETGDTTLQRELNTARAQIGRQIGGISHNPINKRSLRSLQGNTKRPSLVVLYG